MTNHTGALYARIAGKYVRYTHTGADVQRMEETIKGLDRMTQEYSAICADKDKTNEELRGLIKDYVRDQLALQAKVDELDRRLAGQSELHKAVETFKRINEMPVKQTPF
jgi:hypothetical protein